ncbi:22729_t:CDS:1, partial [Dentiscutata erythropus]
GVVCCRLDVVEVPSFGSVWLLSELVWLSFGVAGEYDLREVLQIDVGICAEAEVLLFLHELEGAFALILFLPFLVLRATTSAGSSSGIVSSSSLTGRRNA